MRRYILRPDPCRPSKYHHRRIWWGAGEVIKLQNLPKKWTKTRQTLTHWNMSRDTPMTNEYGILLWWLCHESLLLLISRTPTTQDTNNNFTYPLSLSVVPGWAGHSSCARGAVPGDQVWSREQSRGQHPPAPASDPIEYTQRILL